MIGITLAGIVVACWIAVEHTHVVLDEHELLNSLGAQGIPQLGMDKPIIEKFRSNAALDVAILKRWIATFCKCAH
jgi:predicted oxidoreductase